MKPFIKSKLFLILTASTIVFILILYNIPTKTNDPFVTLIYEDNDYLEEENPSYFFNWKINYTLQPEKCQINTKYIWIITSYFGNVETRSSMRRAFSNNYLTQMGIKKVFLLGEAVRDKYTTQKAVENEHKRFGDILQGSFQEAYKNLTYKHLMGLKWAASYCFNTKYIIKMDDDIVVNLKGINTLLEHTSFSNNKFLAGYVLKNMVPIREPSNKWFVTKEEFNSAKYPTFLSGWLYITNPLTAQKLINIVHHFKYFWIDDLFITGILASKLRIHHTDLKEFYINKPEEMICCYEHMVASKEQCDYLVGPNGGDNNLFNKFNSMLGKCEEMKCRKTKQFNRNCKLTMTLKGKGVIEDFRLV